MPNLVELIQRIARRAIEESQPTAVVFGTVVSASPLKINIEQKLTLESAHLVLTNNVKDHDVDITLEGNRRKYTIHKNLKNGEKVILLRQQGGQKYIVLDKVVV